MKNQAEYRAVTVDFSHQTSLGMLQVEIEGFEITESCFKSVINRLEEEVRKLENKGKEYDKLVSQGVKNMIQMKAYGERADIR